MVNMACLRKLLFINRRVEKWATVACREFQWSPVLQYDMIHRSTFTVSKWRPISRHGKRYPISPFTPISTTMERLITHLHFNISLIRQVIIISHTFLFRHIWARIKIISPYCHLFPTLAVLLSLCCPHILFIPSLFPQHFFFIIYLRVASASSVCVSSSLPSALLFILLIFFFFKSAKLFLQIKKMAIVEMVRWFLKFFRTLHWRHFD